MKTVHTHRGHCQSCGRIQAVDNDSGRIAQHGYHKKFGYFVGICEGAGYPALEKSRDQCDYFIEFCRSAAIGHDRIVISLQSGDEHPLMVNQYDGGRLVRKRSERDYYTWETVKIKWDDADSYARATGLEVAIGENQQAARFLRHHAKTLQELAARVFGQPLIAVGQEGTL